jgi:hypothetical protein
MTNRMTRTRLACQLSAIVALSLGASSVYADEAFSADSKWMTGDWGGERTKLIEQGIDIKADYVGEVGANLHGGYNDDKTARYSDQFGLGVALDLQKLWGWDNTQAKIQLTNRNGENISNDRIGDPRAGTLSSSQEVYGRGHMVRLTQLWIQHQFLDGKLDVKAGYFRRRRRFQHLPLRIPEPGVLWLASGQLGHQPLVQLAGQSGGTADQVQHYALSCTRKSVPTTRTRRNWSTATASSSAAVAPRVPYCRLNWCGRPRSMTCRANTVSVTTKALRLPMT